MPKIRHATIDHKLQKRRHVKNTDLANIVAVVRKAKNQAQLKAAVIALAELVSDLIQSMED